MPLILGIVAAVPLRASVQDANLSGAWRMVSATGDRAQFRVPDQRTTVIEQTGTLIRVRVTTMLNGRQVEQAYTFSTAGDERVDSVGGGGTIRSTARWDGRTLVVRLVQATSGGVVEAEDRYELTADGDTLTIRRTMDRNGVRATLAMAHVRSGSPAANTVRQDARAVIKRST
jgi:hypothetical protein